MTIAIAVNNAIFDSHFRGCQGVCQFVNAPIILTPASESVKKKKKNLPEEKQKKVRKPEDGTSVSSQSNQPGVTTSSSNFPRCL